MDPIRLVVRPRDATPGDATPGDPLRSTTVGGGRGPGGLPVHRTLPERRIAAIGAWCLLEYFGDPDTAPRLLESPARPEAGLQSLTLPAEGLVRRRDNVGNDHLVRQGGVWLSTSGRGRSVAESGIDDPRGGRHAGRFLHGVRLAAALPTAARGMPERLQVIPDPPLVSTPTMRATILVGGLAGDHREAVSPALTHTPLLAANLTLATGTERLALDPAFEHGVLLLAGQVSVDGTPLLQGELAYLPLGRDRLDLATLPGCHLLLIGGAPFEEGFILWWNIVAGSHGEIVAARAAWEAAAGPFSTVPDGATRAEAPPLPSGRLRPRRGSVRIRVG